AAPTSSSAWRSCSPAGVAPGRPPPPTDTEHIHERRRRVARERGKGGRPARSAAAVDRGRQGGAARRRRRAEDGRPAPVPTARAHRREPTALAPRGPAARGLVRHAARLREDCMHTSEDSWADEAGERIGADYAGDGSDRLRNAGETLSAIDTEVRAFVKENPF